MKITPFFTDYTLSLKTPCAEEAVDLAVFRPLGYLFVKFILPFPVTPNQVSSMAMACGIAAGFFLFQGTPHGFLIGGMLYGLSNVLDCSDGMLARIKKNGTATGRIVDGVVDYVTAAAVFTGLGIGLTKAVHLGTLHLPCSAWLLVIIAALSTALHAIFSDYYRTAYLDRLKAPSSDSESDLEKFSAELRRLNIYKGRSADKIMIRLYLGYLKLQAGNARHHRNNASSSAPAAVKPATVILWNLIGPSTHISFFMLGAFLFKPMVFFVFVVIVANAWMLFLLLHRTFRNLLPEHNRHI